MRAAGRESGAEAVHPGYGFLSANPEFAAALQREGVAFIGPRPEHMRAFSLKHTAREIAEKSGVPLLPGSPLIVDLDDAMTQAGEIGYPVMLKSTAGGGGIRLQLCHSAADMPRLYGPVPPLPLPNFQDSGPLPDK